mmetsp:Transcript_11518/g.29278  ORF Transcript_11518/g.29278 Transcript_11518/m.29278 type:complete len:269 (+) Transcript_11518:533-1339(+)
MHWMNWVSWTDGGATSAVLTQHHQHHPRVQAYVFFLQYNKKTSLFGLRGMLGASATLHPVPKKVCPRPSVSDPTSYAAKANMAASTSVPPGSTGSKRGRHPTGSSRPSGPIRHAARIALCLYAMAGGRMPKTTSTPNAPALSRAARKTSGLVSAKTTGGTSATAHGLGSVWLTFMPSATKSARPQPNPRKDVDTAKNSNARTSPAVHGDAACSAAMGSPVASAVTLPSTAASHRMNISAGIAVPASTAVVARFLSPSSDAATTGTTWW